MMRSICAGPSLNRMPAEEGSDRGVAIVRGDDLARPIHRKPHPAMIRRHEATLRVVQRHADPHEILAVVMQGRPVGHRGNARCRTDHRSGNDVRKAAPTRAQIATPNASATVKMSLSPRPPSRAEG